MQQTQDLSEANAPEQQLYCSQILPTLPIDQLLHLLAVYPRLRSPIMLTLQSCRRSISYEGCFNWKINANHTSPRRNIRLTTNTSHIKPRIVLYNPLLVEGEVSALLKAFVRQGAAASSKLQFITDDLIYFIPTPHKTRPRLLFNLTWEMSGRLSESSGSGSKLVFFQLKHLGNFWYLFLPLQVAHQLKY